MRLDCPELRLRSVLGRLSWGKRYTGDAGSGLRGGQEANLTNMGNEATVSTSQCVHQSAWFHGSLAHLICQCQEVRGYRDPEGLGGLESEARPHSVPQISTRRRNKAISSYPSLWSPMYAARP